MKGAYLMEILGLEPKLTICKTAVLPIKLYPHNALYLLVCTVYAFNTLISIFTRIHVYMN